MRGKPDDQGQVYYAIDLESWIAEDHPLRAVKRRADEVLSSMRKDFDRAYSTIGRRSIPPEILLEALLLQALYSIRSERQLAEQIQMNLLYRWFIDLSLDAPVRNATTFTKNRERFEKHVLLRRFFDRVVEKAYVADGASSEHFTVDGTLIESYASMKSLRPKDTKAERVSEGERRGGRRRSGQPDGELPGREAEQPDASLADRSRGAAGPEEPRRGRQALPFGSCADGESKRIGRGRQRQRGERLCREGGSPEAGASDEASAAGPSEDPGRGQGLCSRCLPPRAGGRGRGRSAGPHPEGSDPWRRPRGPSSAAGEATAEDEAVPGGSAGSEASRGDLRMDQDHRRPPAKPPRRSLEAVPAGSGRERRLQPPPDGSAGAMAEAT